MPTDYHSHEVLKIHKTKFFICPAEVISNDTWDLVRMVNLCTDNDGNIIHLPEPQFSIMDQPPKFLAAVELLRQERNSDWYRDLAEQRAKDKANV